MILVTGATGQLGTAVVQQLLKKTSATNIAALVRDPNKAVSLKEQGVDIRIGNYDDTASLDSAMQGVDRVLLIAGTDENKRRQHHQNVVDAAKKGGVGCIAYTSRDLKDRNTLANRLMVGHFQTEDDIIASGLNYIIFRNILYMDTVPFYVGQNVLDTGIRVPAGEGRVSFALRRDMGEAIANALVESTCDNKTYKLTGSETYSFGDIAATLSELSGKEVTYTPVEAAAFEAQMAARNVPAPLVQFLIGFLTDIKNGQEDDVSPDLENLLGRKPTSLKEGLKTLFNL